MHCSHSFIGTQSTLLSHNYNGINGDWKRNTRIRPRNDFSAGESHIVQPGPRAINYTDLYDPPPKSVLASQYNCHFQTTLDGTLVSLDPHSVSVPKGIDVIASPQLYLPSELASFDPAWTDCAPGIYGAWDPPRWVTPAAAMAPPVTDARSHTTSKPPPSPGMSIPNTRPDPTTTQDPSRQSIVPEPSGLVDPAAPWHTEAVSKVSHLRPGAPTRHATTSRRQKSIQDPDPIDRPPNGRTSSASRTSSLSAEPRATPTLSAKIHPSRKSTSSRHIRSSSPGDGLLGSPNKPSMSERPGSRLDPILGLGGPKSKITKSHGSFKSYAFKSRQPLKSVTGTRDFHATSTQNPRSSLQVSSSQKTADYSGDSPDVQTPSIKSVKDSEASEIGHTFVTVNADDTSSSIAVDFPLIPTGLSEDFDQSGKTNNQLYRTRQGVFTLQGTFKATGSLPSPTNLGSLTATPNFAAVTAALTRSWASEIVNAVLKPFTDNSASPQAGPTVSETLESSLRTTARSTSNARTSDASRTSSNKPSTEMSPSTSGVKYPSTPTTAAVSGASLTSDSQTIESVDSFQSISNAKSSSYLGCNDSANLTPSLAPSASFSTSAGTNRAVERNGGSVKRSGPLVFVTAVFVTFDFAFGVI